MLPVIDYGSIAFVIPEISAVGGVEYNEDEKSYDMEVFISGDSESHTVCSDTEEEAVKIREELIGMIAHYHFIKMFGPDFDVEEYFNKKK
jgi:hypothetical protein